MRRVLVGLLSGAAIGLALLSAGYIGYTAVDLYQSQGASVSIQIPPPPHSPRTYHVRVIILDKGQGQELNDDDVVAWRVIQGDIGKCFEVTKADGSTHGVCGVIAWHVE